MPIKFGTDGWRAVISDEFTFANVRHVANAIGDYLLETRNGSTSPVVVGFDTRFLSDRYALEVARGLAAKGLSVYLSRSDCPTPAMAYAICHLKAVGGVMITASHNPPRYNGIKFKGPHGGPGLPAETQRIEAILERNLAQPTAPAAEGLAPANLSRDYAGVTRFDPMPAYLTHIRTLVDFQTISASGLRVAVDPMYGAGRGYIAAFLRECGCQVTQIHGEMNPGFGGIHPEPIERNLDDLVATMRSGSYDLGLATDGDADRIGAVDAQGEFVDPHRIFSLVLRHLVEERHWSGAVVKTVSTTQLLNRLCQHYGLPLHETPVGFNYICDWILKDDVLIGGEESGGITIKGHVPDGDGILIGLLLTELVAYQRKPLHDVISELMAEFGEFHYARKDVHTPAFDKKELTKQLLNEAPDKILHHQVVHINNSDGVKYVLDDDSWLLIRPSGTEPLLRIYAEAHDRQEVQQLLTAGVSLAHL
jgi:alpha-D-glucose phosphate-specific phosphoglucomutase